MSKKLYFLPTYEVIPDTAIETSAGGQYSITLDTGDTVNVEYGDENISITETTIIEGCTIYQCAVCSGQYKDSQGTGPARRIRRQRKRRRIHLG